MAAKELKVKITADNKPLKAGLDDSKKQVNSFSGVVKKAGAALLGAFAARELLRGIKNTVVELGNMADRLLDLEQITGISTDRLQEYEQVARVAGVNSETLANAVQGLTQRMARGQTESSPLNLALKQLGINARTASGEMRNGADITEDAIDKLAKMENITERNVLGAMLFTGAWKDLAPVLALGADGIEAARKQAHELGLVMDKEALESANNFRIELETLQRQLKQVGNNIGLFLIPVLNNLFRGFKKIQDVIRETFKDFTSGVIQDDMEEVNQLAESLLRTGAVGSIEEGESRATQLILQQLEKRRQFYEGYYGDISQLADREERIQARQTIQSLDARIDALKRFSNQTITVEEERLGEIERLQASLAAKEEEYVKTNSELRRQALAVEILDIQEKIKLLGQEATLTRKINEFLAARTGGDMGAPERMTSQSGALPVQTGSIVTDYNRALGETIILQNEAALSADKWAQTMQSVQMIAQDAAYSIGEAFGQMAASGGRATAQLVNQAIAQAIAAIIRQLATTLPFPANIAAIAGAGMFSGIMRSQIPAFADGAVAFGPTLGLMGEYANASTNPEIIAPLDKLQGMLGGGTGEVEFRIKGQELWGVLKKYENRLNQNS